MSKCKSCRSKILWLKTSIGKNMPIDWAEEFQGDKIFDYKRHKSHFASCPDAEHHRKRKDLYGDF